MRMRFVFCTWPVLLGSAIVAAAATPPTATSTWSDPRYFPAGTPIFANGYCDQPYVVVLPDGVWLCAFTTGAGQEGTGGQHIVATRSPDRGRTWSQPVPIEPASGPVASWAMPYLTSFGRVYVFYAYNGDRIHSLPRPGQPPQQPIRDDMLGWYCFKYSDDGGRTWSERFRLPVRTTACDLANQWGGKVQIMWGIGKPQSLHDGGMIFGFTKLGKYMLDNGEGWFFRCDNIQTERDPRKLEWQNLPTGDHGVRHPDYGSVQEEHNLVQLSDGTLYCVYRTTLGFVAFSTSRDRGSSWSLPRKMRYATGAVVPSPRACPRLFKCHNGRYLFWFENNHSRSFDHRNPAWLAGGVESPDGTIRWSQPEIIVYSDDSSYHTGRFSYPDLIEADGQYWVTCTNKVEARIFKIQPALLYGLWAQVDPTLELERNPPPAAAHWDHQALANGPISLENWNRARIAPDCWLEPNRRDQSLTLQFTVQLDAGRPNPVLFDARTADGDGLVIQATPDHRVALTLKSGADDVVWRSDPELVAVGKPHRVTVILDNGPGIIMGLVDGKFCDGDSEEPFGWHRYRDLDAVKNHRLATNRPAPRVLQRVPFNESRTAQVDGRQLRDFAIYNRALNVSEVTGPTRTASAP